MKDPEQVSDSYYLNIFSITFVIGKVALKSNSEFSVYPNLKSQKRKCFVFPIQYSNFIIDNILSYISQGMDYYKKYFF